MSKTEIMLEWISTIREFLVAAGVAQADITDIRKPLGINFYI